MYKIERYIGDQWTAVTGVQHPDKIEESMKILLDSGIPSTELRCVAAG